MHYAKAKYLVVRLRQENDNLKKTLAVAKNIRFDSFWDILCKVKTGKSVLKHFA